MAVNDRPKAGQDKTPTLSETLTRADVWEKPRESKVEREERQKQEKNR